MPLQTFSPLPQVRQPAPEQNPLAQLIGAGVTQVPLPSHVDADVCTAVVHWGGPQHDWGAPQDVVAVLFPLSTHADTPVEHDVVPVLQGLSGWQAVLGTHAAQLPV
jgi:hypothetical protein